MSRGFDFRPTLLAFAAVAASSCTVLTAHDDEQCRVVADCWARGGTFERALYCSASHLCVEVPCSSDATCAPTPGGEQVLCRKRDGMCVAALRDGCQTIIGDLRGDVFGAVLSTTGSNSYLGVPELDAIRLGVGELDRYGGIPSASDHSTPTSVGVVACDDESDATKAAAAARHLVSTLGLHAVIGASTSGNTLKVANDVSIREGALLISPSSTSIAITNLLDENLVWRTASADVVQVKTLTLLTPAVEAATATLRAGSPLRVVILHKGDPYGVSYAQALIDTVRFNERSATENVRDGNLTVINYGLPDDPSSPPDYEGVIRTATDATPHVAFVIGLREAVTTLMSGIEARWTLGAYRPRYFFGTVISGNDVVQSVGSNDDLRARVLGVVPGTTSPTFGAFVASYRASNKDSDPTSFGAANAYDALYALAYATFVARTNGAAPSGRALSNAMASLTSSGRPPIAIGAASLTNIFSELNAFGNADIEGASGPLDFDLATGDVSSDVQIMCLPSKNGRAQASKPSGWYYEARTGKLVHPDAAPYPSCP